MIHFLPFGLDISDVKKRITRGKKENRFYPQDVLPPPILQLLETGNFLMIIHIAVGRQWLALSRELENK